jgi:putative addiction module killer protein
MNYNLVGMELLPRVVRIYEKPSGKAPYQQWFDELGKREQMAVDARLTRLRHGNLGTYRAVGAGVKELKIDLGPGYRIYFGEDGDTVVVLLCAGDKGSQSRDIKKAQEYWADYLS